MGAETGTYPAKRVIAAGAASFGALDAKTPVEYWINTYHPLAGVPSGPWASFIPPLSPFADASCRREPDLEAERPAITGLCRTRTRAVLKFRRDDVVLYFTVKDSYFGLAPHRRLTAVLRVIAELKSHAAAARWYEQNGFALPRNIMVPGNPPLPLKMTEGGYRESGELVLPVDDLDSARILAHWDREYQQRRYKVGDVRVCLPLRVNVSQGFVLSERTVRELFGVAGFPNTQWRPAAVSRCTAELLLRATGNEDLVGSIDINSHAT